MTARVVILIGFQSKRRLLRVLFAFCIIRKCVAFLVSLFGVCLLFSLGFRVFLVCFWCCLERVWIVWSWIKSAVHFTFFVFCFLSGCFLFVGICWFVCLLACVLFVRVIIGLSPPLSSLSVVLIKPPQLSPPTYNIKYYKVILELNPAPRDHWFMLLLHKCYQIVKPFESEHKAFNFAIVSLLSLAGVWLCTGYVFRWQGRMPVYFSTELGKVLGIQCNTHRWCMGKSKH